MPRRLLKEATFCMQARPVPPTSTHSTGPRALEGASARQNPHLFPRCIPAQRFVQCPHLVVHKVQNEDEVELPKNFHRGFQGLPAHLSHTTSETGKEANRQTTYVSVRRRRSRGVKSKGSRERPASTIYIFCDPDQKHKQAPSPIHMVHLSRHQCFYSLWRRAHQHPPSW